MLKSIYTFLFCWFVVLCQLEICQGSRLQAAALENGNCRVDKKKTTCSLLSTKDSWYGQRINAYPQKFVLLWPPPMGNYENARRVCEACGLEVAEIWDDDDHDQIINLIKNKYDMDKLEKKYTNTTFWLGASAIRKAIPAEYWWMYQDGITTVRYQHLRFPTSWKNTNASDSGVPDKERDCMSIGYHPGTTPRKISWKVESCDRAVNYVACQFKRKHHCYDESQSKPLSQIKFPLPLAPQTNMTEYKLEPYYISSYPLPWVLAKEACEKEGKALLFFQNEEEHLHFRKIILKYLSNKPQLFHTGFWISARFSGEQQYDRLGWWVNNEVLHIKNWKNEGSGGITKNWGVDPFREDAKTLEPYDSQGQGKENCVHVQFNYNSKKGTSWYTSECENDAKFFICRDEYVHSENESSVSYCEKDQFVKKETKDCDWNLIMKKKKPECVCTTGLHGLTDHHSCNSRLLVGERCIKLYTQGVIHWRILSQDLIATRPWLIGQSRNKKSENFIEWFTLKQGSTRQIFGYSNVYYAGLEAYQIGSHIYCFQPTSKLSGTDGEFYEVKIRNDTSNIIYAEKCIGAGAELKGKLHKKATPQTSECKLKPCKSPEDKQLAENPFEKQCKDVYEGSRDEDCEYNEIVKRQDLATTTEPPELIIAPEVGSKSIDINRQMMVYSIDTAFFNSSSTINVADLKPSVTWRILERIIDIASNVCSCMVHTDFLQKALVLFKVAHYGQSYEYPEFFSDNEEQEIFRMLEECKANALQEKVISCAMYSCNTRVSHVAYRSANKHNIQKPVDITGYLANDHHHVVEAIWNAIDLWNVACIKEFKNSYLLYHHLEQGLESLFTQEIRKLWHFPNVQAEYYKQLLGPFEAAFLSNLKQCVGASYERDPKVHRLIRPKTSPTNTLGRRIRQRKTKEFQIAKGYIGSKAGNGADSIGNASTQNDRVFCSRDQFCMKW